MKKLLLRFIGTYLLFVALFVLQKFIFMLIYNTGAMPRDYLDVIWHGLPLDLASAGYLSVIPGILLTASLWFLPQLIRPAFRFYYAIISLFLSIIFICDLVLYNYWGFRLDSTPLFYFFTSPKDAFASAGVLLIIVGLLSMIVCTCLLYLLFTKVLVEKKRETVNVLRNRGMVSIVMILATGLLFIPIRGGFTVSTMNISKAYYSDNMKLNHATINPFFSLLDSLTRETDFDKQYRYMSTEEADEVFSQLVDHPIESDSVRTDTVPQLFTNKQPNIIFIVLESFMSKTMESLGGIPNVAINMDKFAREGILFSNFYANSFRTDRALVSIFSGYPAQPTTSIMKYPKKTQSLPSIPLSLKKGGYNLGYYYGGDADFTNMRSYLLSMGINTIVSDQDFSLTDRLSKWGVHDHFVFNRLADDLNSPQQPPFMKILQTSSSHEPFKVPFSRLENPYLNSVAYTDSCLGDFVDKFRHTEWWDNSILVLIPDHASHYPPEIGYSSPERYQIPFIIMGGAIKRPMQIDTYASQIDIAATLLDQLGLPHSEFTFSKNILNPLSPHFAFYTIPNVFGMITKNSETIFDCESGRVLSDKGEKPGENLIKGKALLQKLYDDLAER